MAKPNGAAIEEAAIPAPKPDFSGRNDVFTDLADYMVDPAAFGIEEAPVVLQVKFQRPSNQEWVRCHAEPGRIGYFDCVRDRRANKLYAVHPAVRPLVRSQARPYRVLQAITTDRELYLWPAPAAVVMESDLTHHNAQQQALTGWVRVEWDGGGFRAVSPKADLGAPQWPDLSFMEILKLGLAGRLIDREDHPLVKRLLGLG
jgi:hypothetical protein